MKILPLKLRLVGLIALLLPFYYPSESHAVHPNSSSSSYTGPILHYRLGDSNSSFQERPPSLLNATIQSLQQREQSRQNATHSQQTERALLEARQETQAIQNVFSSYQSASKKVNR